MKTTTSGLLTSVLAVLVLCFSSLGSASSEEGSSIGQPSDDGVIQSSEDLKKTSNTMMESENEDLKYEDDDQEYRTGGEDEDDDEDEDEDDLD